MLFSQTHTFLPKIFQFGALLGCFVGFVYAALDVNLTITIESNNVNGYTINVQIGSGIATPRLLHINNIAPPTSE